MVDELLELYARRGDRRYSEAVSQSEHALQTAALARAAGADDTLVVAALFHDVGHLLLGDAEADHDRDLSHEHVGGAYLRRCFGPAVTAPVALHVAAKRYLCAVEPGYHDGLSPASVHSLRLQGGPMRPTQVEAFEARSAFAEAVALRRWDDAAKVPGLDVPGWESYVGAIRSSGRGASR